MLIVEAVILGVLQGVTEFWPISSSAHLALLPRILGWKSSLLNSLVFDVALHAGTLLAVVSYFWDDLTDLVLCWFKRKDTVIRRENRRLGRRLVLATLPAALAALYLERYAENAFREPWIIAISLIVGGVLMAAADLLIRQKEDLDRMRRLTAVLIGCFQAFALIPGVSRSGASLTALRFFKFKRPDSARFAFLISIPLIAGAAAYEGRKIAGMIPGSEWPVLLAGILSSFIVGYMAIRTFMRWLRSHSLAGFALYRLVLGAVVLAWVYFRVG